MWSVEQGGLLVKALLPSPGARVRLACAGGDLALALVAAGAGAVELSGTPPLLALAELKWAAAHTFPATNLRSLLGLDGLGRRIFLYHYLRDRVHEGRGSAPPELTSASRGFWDAHEALLGGGLAEAGQRERGLARVRRCLARLGWTPERLLARPQRAASSRRLRTCLLLGLGPSAASTQLASRLQAELASGPGPLARWALSGAVEHLASAHPYLSDDGARAIAVSPCRPHAVASLDAQGPALDGLYLGAWTAPLDPLLPCLAPGGRLLLRAERPPTAAGLELDRHASAELQARDHGLLGSPPWLLRRQGGTQRG